MKSSKMKKDMTQRRKSEKERLGAGAWGLETPKRGPHQPPATSHQPLLFFCFVIFICFGLFHISSAQDPTAQSQKEDEKKPRYEKISSHLIIVSISGLKADDLNNPETTGLRIPTIQSLRTKGAHAIVAESVYPSVRNPAHASIATGVFPADHGVYSDFPFDTLTGAQSEEPYRLAKDIKTDTLWDAAKRGGFVTAAVGYPLTAGATIDFNIPVAFDDGYLADNEAGIYKLISKKLISPPDLLDQLGPEIMSSPFTGDKKLKEIAGNQRMDQFKADAAAHIIETHRPNLLLVNLDSYAKAVRRYGVQSREAIIALEFTDELLKKIIDPAEKISSETTIFIVSDFGLMRVEKKFNPNVVLAKKDWLKTGGKGRITSWRAVAQTFGGSAAIFLREPQDKKAIAEIRELFDEIHKRPDSPIWQIVTAQEASKLGTDPRPVFYLDVAPAYAVSSRATGASISTTSEKAAHGYLPSRSDMLTPLIIYGNGIKPGSKIEYGRLIDIAPTAARLLGLEMRTARGRVYSEVISQ
jgi:predicted AlkP superfamily pyrophosphatase or phosphodiesterase